LRVGGLGLALRNKRLAEDTVTLGGTYNGSLALLRYIEPERPPMTDMVDAIEAEEPERPRLLDVLGPGLITGASDDDPSGIATYSQAGAQFGYTLGWTLLLTYPLMCAIQMVSAHIGRVTGKGLAGNMRRHYPATVLYILIGLLVIANVINLGADLGAMAAALHLLLPGPAWLYIAGFALVIALLEIFVRYSLYASVLRWLTLSLFAYVATVFAVGVPWGAVAFNLLVPHVQFGGSSLTMVVAIFGTTISPYLFFWQAAEEVEDEKESPSAKPLLNAPGQAPKELRRIQWDTLVGMGFSNLIALFIMLTTAATLNAHNITDIQTSSQAAEALRPIAGSFAFVVFARRSDGALVSHSGRRAPKPSTQLSPSQPFWAPPRISRRWIR
jgi:Mn2+/Fe2+ NRAMP family transporter